MNEKHTLVFIHGMGDTQPIESFDCLWAKIRESYDRRESRRVGDFESRYAKCFVDWHGVTEEAKSTVFEHAFGPMAAQRGLPGAALHPFAFGRTFFTFFLGDVVAYVDESPNNIRTTVWAKMKAGLAHGGPYSIVAHSLGSVIAFDFLYHLFIENVLFDPVQDPTASIADLQRRFAGLYTMGSPIGLFMLRKGSLWKREEDARRGGPPFSEIKNPLPQGRTWQNFWDKQDLIAYPLERLFALNAGNAGRPLADVPVGTGPDPISSHIRYWSSAEVAEKISETLR
jgi:hypothetical protein